MIYENIERIKKRKEEKANNFALRYKLYVESESIEEYHLKTTMQNVAKPKLLDEFWWYYNNKNHSKLFPFFIASFPILPFYILTCFSTDIFISFVCQLINLATHMMFMAMVCASLSRITDKIRRYESNLDSSNVDSEFAKITSSNSSTALTSDYTVTISY